MAVGNISGVQNVQTTGLSGQAANLDPEILMMAIVTERQSSLDAVVKGQAAEMNARNGEIKELNNALQTLRKYQNTDKDAKTTSGMGKGDEVALKEMCEACRTLAKFGIGPPAGMEIRSMHQGDIDSNKGAHAFGWDTFKQFTWQVGVQAKGSKEQWGAWIENVKTEIDSKSSNSQMDMIKLQGGINKMNQNIEMLSNITAKFAKTADSIVGNMR